MKSKRKAKSQRLQNAVMTKQLPTPSLPEIDWSVPEWMLEKSWIKRLKEVSQKIEERDRERERGGGREGERGRKEKGKERIRSELTAFPDRIKIRCGRNSSVKIWVHGALLPTSRLSIVFLRTIISHSITRIPFLIIDRFSMSPSLSLCLSVALSPSHYLSLILRQSKIPGNTFDHLLNRNTFML